MGTHVINLTDQEVEALGQMAGVEIRDDADMEYCIRVILEALG